MRDWRIVWLKLLLMKTDVQIATDLWISPRTVKRIYSTFLRTGGVNSNRPSGTTTLFDHEEYLIIDLILRKPGIQLAELSHAIQERFGGGTFAVSSLCSAAHRLGFTRKKVCA